MSESMILIVGTTSDYIDLIHRRIPGLALFLTDRVERSGAVEPRPPEGTEVLADLGDYDATLGALRGCLDAGGIVLSGIACFDCESMHLAARLAKELSLRYPSPESVRICRNKYESKRLWREAGLPCPAAKLIRDAKEASAFQQRMRKTVIKPTSGSGSEYVFSCRDEAECGAAVAKIRSGLSALRENPLKPLYSRDSNWMDGGAFCVMEEFVQGQEYSCDFIVDGPRLDIVRITRKVPMRNTSFGTTLAYQLCRQLPSPLDTEGFSSQLWKAAHAVGLDRAICMMDFIVDGKDAVMIEMTPRPGGDCLPPLLLRSGDFDMLSFAVRFAGGERGGIPGLSAWKPCVGLRLLATREGVVAKFHTDALRSDGRVLDLHLKYGAGHRIVLPPADYDSRVLGYVIFNPSTHDRLEAECLEITDLLRIEMKESR